MHILDPLKLSPPPPPPLEWTTLYIWNLTTKAIALAPPLIYLYVFFSLKSQLSQKFIEDEKWC